MKWYKKKKFYQVLLINKTKKNKMIKLYCKTKIFKIYRNRKKIR